MKRAWLAVLALTCLVQAQDDDDAIFAVFGTGPLSTTRRPLGPSEPLIDSNNPPQGQGQGQDPWGQSQGQGTDNFGSPQGQGTDPFGSPQGQGTDPFGSPQGQGTDPFGSPQGQGTDSFGSPQGQGQGQDSWGQGQGQGQGEPPQAPEPPEDGDCECVPYYLCPNGSILTDGSGIIDIRFQGGSACENYMEVCCKAPLPPDMPITPKPIGHLGCGNRHADGVGYRITGDADNEAQFGEFPWMVALLREEHLEDGTILNVYQCGGALIHPQVVLTAAHCVVGKDPAIMKARAGEWDTQTKQELYPYQDRRIGKVITHERYYSGGLHNDIALLITTEPFDYAENVDIVCLPLQGDIVQHNECFASGWGKDVYAKEGKYQVILKRVELPIVPRQKCQEELRKTRLGSHFRLHESFICAGGEFGKDTCKGDGGGPLVCPIPGKSQYQQVGIVAWGIGCGENNPAVYVHVAHFRDWIDKHMKSFNLETEYGYH